MSSKYRKIMLSERYFNSLMRQNTKKMLQKRCYVCGGWKKLQIHHKVPKKFGGSEEFDNFVLLCERHHKELHKPVERRTKINPTPQYFIKRLEEMKRRWK